MDATTLRDSTTGNTERARRLAEIYRSILAWQLPPIDENEPAADDLGGEAATGSVQDGESVSAPLYPNFTTSSQTDGTKTHQQISDQNLGIEGGDDV